MSNPRDKAEYYVLTRRREISRMVSGQEMRITYSMRGPDNKVYLWHDSGPLEGENLESSEEAINRMTELFSALDKPIESNNGAIPRLRDVRKGETPGDRDEVIVFADNGDSISHAHRWCDNWYGAEDYAPLTDYPYWVPVEELFKYLKSGGE